MNAFSMRRLGALTAAALAVATLAPAATAAPADPASELRDRVDEARSGPGSLSVAAQSITPQQDELGSQGATPDLRFACPDDRVPADGFTDLAPPFVDAIGCLIWYGVTTGRTPTTFDQAGTVNRAQMAVFIHRMLDAVVELPTYDGTSAFRDVAASGFGAAEINVLASDEFVEWFGEAVIAGRADGTFQPSSAVNRAQASSMLARAFRVIADSVEAEYEFVCDNVFPDQATIPPAHRQNVELLCGFSIVQGRQDGSFGPTTPVTRGQMAAILMRTFDVFAQAEITFLPDRNLFVDRAACPSSGATGTPVAPFCTIQQATDRAAGVEDDVVLVRVRHAPGTPAYTGAVNLRAGAGALVILEAQAQGARVPIVGNVTLDGAPDADVLVLLGFDVSATGTGPAVTATGDGLAVLEDVGASGVTAVLVDQEGAFGDTVVLDSRLEATDRVLDIVASSTVPYVEGTTLVATGAQAFVVVPAGASSDNLDDFTDPSLQNVFDPASPVTGTVDGRAALVPSG